MFLLNNYPCRMVELVGWAAAVEHKEATMTITGKPVFEFSLAIR